MGLGSGAGDGWLWDHGTLRDLNSLVAPSAVHLSQAQFINDRGEIACYGVLPNGNVHAVLLVPAGLAASEGLTSNTPALGAAGPAMATQGRPVSCSIKDLVRARPIQRMRHWVC